MAVAGTDLARRSAVARCVTALARPGWPCRVLLGWLLPLACWAPLSAQPPELVLPTEAEATAALKKVQAVLVDELKLEHNLGPNSRLANKLGQLNGEEFGTFLGSVAGGDADAAFQSIGRFGANYFVADLAAKWAELEFEGKELLQYVPADPQQTLAILQDLWWGKGQQAAENCHKMVREQAVKKLKQLSTDAATRALDWVLSDTTGGSPGAILL